MELGDWLQLTWNIAVVGVLVFLFIRTWAMKEKMDHMQRALELHQEAFESLAELADDEEDKPWRNN